MDDTTDRLLLIDDLDRNIGFTLSQWELLNTSNISTGDGNATESNVPLPADSDMLFQQAVQKLNMFGIPVIIIIGVCGNTLSFVVFVCTQLRFQSCSVYLAFLNIVDIGFLLCLGAIWFGWLRINVINRQVICQCVVYVSYVCAFLSSWTVVAFTIERYIVVFYPLKKHILCSPRRAKFIVLGLCIAALGLYCFSTWMTGIITFGDQQVCVPLPQYEMAWKTLAPVDTFITFIVPSLLVILLNVGITVKIYDFIHRREGLSASMTSDEERKHDICIRHYSKTFGSGNNCKSSKLVASRSSRVSCQKRKTNFVFSATSQHSSQVCVRHNYQIRITRTLVIVSSVFVILNLPSHAFRTYACITYLVNGWTAFTKNALLWQQILQLVYYINFACNVFLYSSSSRSFRSALKRLCNRWKQKVRSAYVTVRQPFNMSYPRQKKDGV